MSNNKPKYKTILLKLSGEAFQNKESGLSIDPERISEIAVRIKRIREMNIRVAMVIGGGNIFRGLSGQARGIDRTSGDHMGMLATIINGLALQNALEKIGQETRVLSAIEMPKLAEPFILRKALRHLDKERVVIFAGGTGNPYFSTDTAAALRASEIGADIMFKATKVEGVYTKDPLKDPTAKQYKKLSYNDALSKSLRIMDAAAFSLCMDNHIPILVFNFFKEHSIEDAATGKEIGTLVTD